MLENAKDLCRAMDKEYLDFFYKKPVQSFSDVVFAEMKPLCAFQTNGSTEQIEWFHSEANTKYKFWWLPVPVPMKYTSRAEGTISGERKFYQEFFEKLYDGLDVGEER